MGWQDLVQAEGTTLTLPWIGGRVVQSPDRIWNLKGHNPPRQGWWLFRTSGNRTASWVPTRDTQQPSDRFFLASRLIRGYLVGDRLIPDTARVVLDPDQLIDQTLPVQLVEPGADRFCRALVFRLNATDLVFYQTEWPQGPETDVEAAWLDRLPNLDHIKGVTPALDLAFRWLSRQRDWNEKEAIRREEAAAEAARLAEQERRQLAAEKAKALIGTGEGRRLLAAEDFEAAARAALAVSGSELLDVRASHHRGEMVVQYKVGVRRLECVVDRATMRVIDAGICLADHATGVKGDDRFVLESLPGVVLEAQRLHKLVVWRHVAGDIEDARHWNDDDDGWNDDDDDDD